MRCVIAAIFALMAFPGSSVAAPIAGLQVPCAVERVIDGDSIKLVCTLFPGLTQRINVRIVGTDTPESGWRARCDSERRRAGLAKEFVEGLVDAGGGVVILTDIALGKFAGRTLGDILTGPDRVSLRAALIDAGHARPYDGGRREGWC